MSKVMLYSHPSTIKSNDEKKGFCKVKGETVDYIIVDEEEVEGCLTQGFYKTPVEAIEAVSDTDTDNVEGGDSDETNETNANNEEENSVSEGGDPIDLKGLTPEEIKAKYTVDELRKVAAELKIKRASRMNEDTLVKKILEKV